MKDVSSERTDREQQWFDKLTILSLSKECPRGRPRAARDSDSAGFGGYLRRGPRRDICRQCNRLDALTLQVGQLSVDVSLQVRPLVAAAETIVEFSQKCPQFTS